ncbi:MAG: hypothetical protein Q9222_003901 [Ikaeria aurantiellina]
MGMAALSYDKKDHRRPTFGQAQGPHETYKSWLVHSSRDPGELPEHINVILDIKPPDQSVTTPQALVREELGRKRKSKSSSFGSVEDIDVTYRGLKPHLDKAVAIQANQTTKNCAVCKEMLISHGSMVLICPEEDCCATSHLVCLAQWFLGNQRLEVLPISGHCPNCNSDVHWVDLVKELSVRTRGGISLPPAQKRAPVRKPQNPEYTDSDIGTNIEEQAKTLSAIVGGSATATTFEPTSINIEDDPLPDGWVDLVNDDDDRSVTSHESEVSSREGSPRLPAKQPQRLEVVIEDSEWDSAEVLD